MGREGARPGIRTAEASRNCARGAARSKALEERGAARSRLATCPAVPGEFVDAPGVLHRGHPFKPVDAILLSRLPADFQII